MMGHKVDVFGVGMTVTDYQSASDQVIEAARQRRSYGVTALATHGLMEAARDDDLRRRVNELDLVTPDGQPVRWAMNTLHRVGLRERVYGPDLVGYVCDKAAREGISVFIFGSTRKTCDAFAAELQRRYRGLIIAGVQPDRFRDATEDERRRDITRITDCGAGIVLVGRGCPRQELWVHDMLDEIPAAMLAVGAAFDYYAGNLRRPPAWMQRHGLEWLARLIQEPRRLWRRYLKYNALFVMQFAGAYLRRLTSRTHDRP